MLDYSGYNIGTLKSVIIDNVSCKGKNNVGNLVGYNTGTVTACEVTNGTLEGTQNMVGGLAGYNTGTVSSSKSSSAVKGINNVGGLVRI